MARLHLRLGARGLDLRPGASHGGQRRVRRCDGLLRAESGRPDSNRRRPAWEAGILPTELRPRQRHNLVSRQLAEKVRAFHILLPGKNKSRETAGFVDPYEVRRPRAQLVGFVPLRTHSASDVSELTTSGVEKLQWPQFGIARWNRFAEPPAVDAAPFNTPSWKNGTKGSQRLCTLTTGMVRLPVGV